MNGKSKEPSVFRFQQTNDMVEGKLLAVRNGSYGNDVYDIKTKKGVVTVFGTKVLDGEIKREYVNKRIKIAYLGEKMSKNGYSYKNFEVSLNGKRSG